MQKSLSESEVTDPDDIDALLDSLDADDTAEEPSESEVTDPDDIDALLDSMVGCR